MSTLKKFFFKLQYLQLLTCFIGLHSRELSQQKNNINQQIQGIYLSYLSYISIMLTQTKTERCYAVYL